MLKHRFCAEQTLTPLAWPLIALGGVLVLLFCGFIYWRAMQKRSGSSSGFSLAALALGLAKNHDTNGKTPLTDTTTRPWNLNPRSSTCKDSKGQSSWWDAQSWPDHTQGDYPGVTTAYTGTAWDGGVAASTLARPNYTQSASQSGGSAAVPSHYSQQQPVAMSSYHQPMPSIYPSVASSTAAYNNFTTVGSAYQHQQDISAYNPQMITTAFSAYNSGPPASIYHDSRYATPSDWNSDRAQRYQTP